MHGAKMHLFAKSDLIKLFPALLNEKRLWLLIQPKLVNCYSERVGRKLRSTARLYLLADLRIAERLIVVWIVAGSCELQEPRGRFMSLRPYFVHCCKQLQDIAAVADRSQVNLDAVMLGVC